MSAKPMIVEVFCLNDGRDEMTFAELRAALDQTEREAPEEVRNTLCLSMEMDRGYYDDSPSFTVSLQRMESQAEADERVRLRALAEEEYRKAAAAQKAVQERYEYERLKAKFGG